MFGAKRRKVCDVRFGKGKCSLMKWLFNVECVDHSQGEFGRESMFDVKFKNHGINKNTVTTNHLEVLWGLLKDNIEGTHKGVSSCYLILYAAEAAFRLTLRDSKLDIAHRIENLIKN